MLETIQLKIWDTNNFKKKQFEMNNLTLMIRYEEKIFGGTEMDDENGDEEEVEDGMREESRKQPLVFVICLV